MWCCFNANTVLEPTKLKPLSAEVPVATKPVTLMFRLPSDEAEATNVKGAEVVDASPEDVLEPPAQGEEVPSLGMNRDECNNPCTILFALSVLGLLYLLMKESEQVDL